MSKSSSPSLEALYLEGDYHLVRRKLIQSKEKFDPGVFHYNLGTVLAKEGRLSASRYNLEKALHKGFIDSRVVGNLRAVKSVLMAKDLESSEAAWSDRTLNFALNVPQPLFLTSTLLLLLGALLLIHFKKVGKVMGKGGRPVLIGGLFTLALVPFLVSQLYLKNIDYAINLEETILREGPSEIYPEIMALDAGSKFIIGDENNGWAFIESPNFLSGWVRRDKLAVY